MRRAAPIESSSVRPSPRAALAAALVALAGAGPALAGNGGFAPVEPRSPNAVGITDTYYLILALTAAVFVIVEGALIVFLVRFRSRGRSRSVEGPQIRGNTSLELAWTVVPVLILGAIFGFVFAKLPDIDSTPPAHAGDALRVKVTARQFYWQFEYPGGQISVDRLVVPVGRVVTLDLVSPDVVHSWWVPALGGKIDAIPGKTTHTWFQTDRVGTYRIRCAELCGIEHAHMTGWVEVVRNGAYGRFLGLHTGASESVGRETVAGVCAKCHGLAGEGDYGPRLAGNSLLLDRRGIATLLREGKGRMPAVGASWGDEQMAATIATLRRRFGPGGSAGGG